MEKTIQHKSNEPKHTATTNPTMIPRLLREARQKKRKRILTNRKISVKHFHKKPIPTCRDFILAQHIQKHHELPTTET